MRKLPLLVALAWISVPAIAAIQYDFVQKNTSDDTLKPVTDLSARATVDGARSRVEFLSGNLYPPGTYVVSTDGSQRLYFVDPSKQWYTEFDAAHAVAALGSSNIQITNLKSDLKKVGERETVAGIESDRYKLTMSYDITVTMRKLPLKQHVSTEIERWVTTRFSGSDAFANNTIRTGNMQIDELIAAETERIPGFVMRQSITTKTSFDPPKKKSELKVPTQRTIVREMWVTRVQEVAPNAALFVVPAGYRRADQPEERSATQVTLTPKPN
jgi:hypothetical protein